MTGIAIAESEEEILSCFEVMQQLRPHLERSEFVARVRLQEAGGYRLAYLREDGDVRAVAGYRILDNLVGIRVFYIDDLVTDSARRSEGHGAKLFQWLSDLAREEKCLKLELDSGVQRFDAHRFYFTNRMVISSYHFRLDL